MLEVGRPVNTGNKNFPKQIPKPKPKDPKLPSCGCIYCCFADPFAGFLKMRLGVRSIAIMGSYLGFLGVPTRASVGMAQPVYLKTRKPKSILDMIPRNATRLIQMIMAITTHQ